jgi:hypothetical protein
MTETKARAETLSEECRPFLEGDLNLALNLDKAHARQRRSSVANHRRKLHHFRRRAATSCPGYLESAALGTTPGLSVCADKAVH